MAVIAPTQPFPSPALGAGAAPGKPANRARPKPRWVRIARWALPIAAVLAVTGLGARALSTRAAAPVHYETAAVDRGPIDAKVTATGTLSALVTVQVGSQVSGRIERLYADFSSPVKKGQVVATIEPSLFRAAVEQARANHAAAVAAVEKARAQRVQAERQHARARRSTTRGSCRRPTSTRPRRTRASRPRTWPRASRSWQRRAPRSIRPS